MMVTESLLRAGLCPTLSLFCAALFAACVQPPAENPAGDDPPASAVLFTEVGREVGIDFVHLPGERRYLLPEIMGSGAALFDYDNDGDLDAYLVQGSDLVAGESPSTVNRLFRNQLVESGELRFVDVTAQSRTGDGGYGMGVAVADIDNDGDLDLYLTNVGPNVLLRNEGDGTFSDISGQALPEDPRWNASAAFLDYDLDGDPDLFHTGYVDFTAGGRDCFHTSGLRDYCSPSVYRPITDRLLRNDGRGRFSDVSVESGITEVTGAGLGVVAADLNSDGWPDLYVANDGMPNQLWINQKNGTFQDTGLFSGSAYNSRGEAEAGMGIAVEDFDGDGDADLFLTHLTGETNTLYVNDGSGTFLDATLERGLATHSLPLTGFGTSWLDVENDGDLDLFVSNGAVTMVEALLGQPYPYHQRNQLLVNQGGRFQDRSDRAGEALALSEVTRGTASGDVDLDGDVDVLLSNNNGPARLLLNQTDPAGDWLQVRVQSAGGGPIDGVRVGVVLADGRKVWRRAARDGSYLSAGDATVHFGLSDRRPIRIIVEWLDGPSESWADVGINRVIALRRGTGSVEP